MGRLGVLAAAGFLTAGLAACGPSQPDKGTQTAVTPAPPEPTPTEKQALLASLPAPYNGADLENGKRKFGLCRSCHTVTPGGANMTGPNLYGVFGRKAGADPKFNYSEAVENAGFVWDAGRLDQWLANPRTFLPGTKMSFMGLKEAKDRIDLIAYLKVESGYKPAPGGPD